MPAPSSRTIRAETSTPICRAGRRLHREGDPAGVEVHRAQDLGVGVVGVDHRHASGHDLAEQPGLGPSPLQHNLGGEPAGRADVGHHRGVEGDPLERCGAPSPRLETSSTAALQPALDHLGHQGRQAGRAGDERAGRPVESPPRRLRAPGRLRRRAAPVPAAAGIQPGPQRTRVVPSKKPSAPSSPMRSPAASKIERTIKAVIVRPKLPVTPSGEQVVRRVAGQRLADPRVRRHGVGDDDLEPARVGAGAFHHHAGGAPLQGLAHERVPVVARPRLADRHEDLAGVQPAMIVGAAGDFPVGATDELGLREQSTQAHRGNPPLGQTVNEPARHRLTPPCLATSRSRPHAAGRTACAGWIPSGPRGGPGPGELDHPRPALDIREPSIRRVPSRWMPRLKGAALLAKPRKKAIPE